MRVIEHVIEYRGRATELTLYPLADIHLGNRACDEDRLDATLDAIAADKDARYVFLGDQFDAINAKDPRFDVRSLPLWLVESWYEGRTIAEAQRDNLLQRILARPKLKGKCLGVIKGNHEHTIYHWSEIDMYNPLVEAVKGKDEQVALDTSGFIVLRFRRISGESTQGQTFTLAVYLHHGWGGGDLSGGVALKLEREMDRFDADLFLMGHHHRIQTPTQARPLRVNDALQLVQPSDKQGAICGTFLRGRLDGVDTYQERKGYRPSPATSEVVVKIRPDKAEVDVVSRTRQEAVVL